MWWIYDDENKQNSNFIGAFLAFLINGEKLTSLYFVGLVLMIIGTVFVVKDTLGDSSVE